MTHGPSQELDVGLHIGHTFQDVSILYPLYAPYRFQQESEHIMFCAVLAIRCLIYSSYIPECFIFQSSFVLYKFLQEVEQGCFYPLSTICVLQTPVRVRTHHVMSSIGNYNFSKLWQHIGPTFSLIWREPRFLIDLGASSHALWPGLLLYRSP